nr:hypothetical protein EUGRSUZ_K00772 [Ipomoea batatas]
MKKLSSSTVIGNKRKLPYSASQDGNVVNTTIRNTAKDYMMGQTSDNRTDKGTTCNINYKQLTGTPKNRFNVTLGSKNSLPLSDITNCNGTIRSKKIKGSLTLTGVSTIDNNVNAHKLPSSATSAAVISGGGDHDRLLLLLEDNSRKVTHAHGSEQINGLPVNLNVINLDCRLVGDEMGGEAGDLVAQALGGDDGNLFQDLLVGVEVEGHARVVALDDLAGGFLHCLRAYATHGCFSGGEEEGCGFSLEQIWWLG